MVHLKYKSTISCLKFPMMITLIVLISCEGIKIDDPNYPPEPYIEFRDIQVIPANLLYPDTIRITIYYRDGDSDLGLNIGEYFNLQDSNKIYLYRADSRLDFMRVFFIDNDNELLKLNHKWKKPDPYDTLPDFVHPYNCTNYTTDTTLYYIDTNSTQVRVKDTLYYQPSVKNFNYFIDFLIKQEDGSFERFQWESFLEYPSCGMTFNTRFRPLSVGNSPYDPFHANQFNHWEGELVYTMISRGFKFELKDKDVKLRIKILDRAFHNSNTIETPVFRFE